MQATIDDLDIGADFRSSLFHLLVQKIALRKNKENTMGKGNVNKAAQKRERNAKKAAAQQKGKSNASSKEDMTKIVCQVCRQGFMCTTQVSDLRDHATGKHSKLPFEQCFPNSS